MQSQFIRRGIPSKTIVVKKNNQLFSSAEQGDKKIKQFRMKNSIRRKGDFNDNQEPFQISKATIKAQLSSESESDSDDSFQKSILSESSKSSIRSARTIKSKSSKRQNNNIKDLTQNLVQQYQTILRKADSQMTQQKQEEIQQKMLDRIAEQTTAQMYVQPYMESKQNESDEENSDHLSQLFSDLANEDDQSDKSDNSNISLEVIQTQNLITNRSNKDIQSPGTPQSSIQIPNEDISTTHVKRRISNFNSAFAGFSHLSVTEQSQSSNEIELDQLCKLQNHYSKIYQKLSSVNGPKNIKFKKMRSFLRYKLLYSSYEDDYPFLKIRKIVSYCYLMTKRLSKEIVRSKIYQYIVTFVTLGNIILFIYEHQNYFNESLNAINFVFFWLYLVDLVLQLFAFGLFRTKFIFLGRIIDTILIVLFYYHLTYKNSVINITPLRMMRLLKQLGVIFEGLQRMIKALIESLKFIFEFTAVVILFVLFFASLGNSLFMGLFNERCIPSEEDEWIQCRQGECPDGKSCVITNNAYNIPTNFNNIIYSFGLILKTVTMDDWSWVMYYTIRSFHPIVWIYYVLIIFVGGFFGFNLPIAVFKTHFSEMQFKTTSNNIEKVEAISKSQFQKIGFYYYVNQMNRYLFSKQRNILIEQPQINKQSQNWDIQPKLLLGSMINHYKIGESNFTQLTNTVKNFSFKYILLPKLNDIAKFYNNLDLKLFTSEIKQQMIIKSFSKSFLLEKYIDYNCNYVPTSHIDILRQSMFLVLKTTENKPFSIYKKKKFYYKPIQSKKKYVQDRKISRSELTVASSQINENKKMKLPIKISLRMKKDNLNTSDIHGSKSSLSSKNNLNQGYQMIKVTDKEKRKFPYFMKQLSIPQESERKPFTLNEKGSLRILVNGVYQDYMNVQQRINTKIHQKKQEGPRVQEEYTKLRRKEFEKKIIKVKNWSGNNVLISSYQLIQKFDDIFRSLNKKDIEIWPISLSGIVLNLRKYAFQIIHFRLTKFLFDLTILINTLFLALQGIIERKIIDKIEDIVTVVLSTEIILQLIVYQPKRIAKNKHHVIELLIVILSLIEFGFSDYLNVSEQYLRLMRSTKCLLFYRCILYIQMARIIGAIASITYKSYIYLAFLMFFMIFTFGLIGMELFANQFNDYHKQGYMQSFDDPAKAFMTVFNIMTNDDWFGVYRIGTEVKKELAVTFSIALVFTLNYFIYGIMMAILLDGFSQYLERESSNEENEFMKEKIKQINKLNKQLDSEQTDDDSETESSSSSSSSIKQYKELANNVIVNSNRNLRRESTSPEYLLASSSNMKDYMQKRDSCLKEKLYHSLQFPPPRNRRSVVVNDSKKKIKDDFNKLKNLTNINLNHLKGQESKKIKLIQENIQQFEKQLLKQNPKLYTGNDCLQSYYIFHKSNNFRKLLYKLSQSVYTKYFIDINLLLSITYLAVPKDIQEEPLLVTLLFILNSIIFVEFIIKSIAYGVFIDKGSYLNYTWKIIDLVYIIIYYVQFFKIGYLPIFKVIETFLFFRPLKLLYRIKWVARVRAALTQSLFDIINVFVVLLMVWLMFAVFSMMLYAEKFGYCEEQFNYDIGIEECQEQGNQWRVYKHNFDNITTAMPALFVISTFDGWGAILWASQNSRESHYGPHPYYSQAPTYLFYLAFCTIGSMFFLQLFTGVLFINLKANSKQIENQQLTQAQIEFKNITEIILFDHPIRSSLPKSLFRKTLANLITGKFMNLFMFSILLINCITIMMVYHSADSHYNHIINLINHLCTIVFTIWLILQAFALGINRFKDNPWRLYNTVVIILGVIDLLIDFNWNWFKQYLHSTQLIPYYQLLRFMYMLRNLKVIILFQGIQNLQRLVRVISFAFPFMFKILFILLIIMVVFAFYGTMLFGHIDQGEVLNDLINFSNFWLAMLALFKCVSGDDFRSIMNDCMHHNPYCQEDPKYCGSPYSQIYFILFMLISNYVLLNLFVLAMIEQFELFFNNQDSILQTYVENIDTFRKAWFKFSCSHGQFLNIRYLPFLLIEIKEPLGCKSYENQWDAAKFSLQYNLICDQENRITYNQLLYEIFYHRYKKQILNQCSEIASEKMAYFHKTMNFRLAYYRRGLNFRRSNIGPQIKLKGNYNALYFQLIALTTFKIWKSYTQQMIQNILTDQQYISYRTIKDTEPIRHSISLKSLDSQESRIKLNDKPLYQKRRQGRLKRVSLQGQQNDYLPGDLINPKIILKRKSSFGINVEEGNVQPVYNTTKVKKKK
ncbi:unnamed protein product [Paramecium sonneborni]|uniref:Ion transport domain-containing protein n=1 Tax=Paramecium sonneborni TaxID=65129 RepID=A0A8S1QR29_9CILI|nr:unnamed protein product [Paramecium sonneborni]